jgi:hypothetical protein
VTLFDFLSLKYDVNVPSKSNKQKKLCKKIFFGWHLKVNDENSRIRIQDPDPDPDPPENVMDPQHWFLPMKGTVVLSFYLYILVNFKNVTEKIPYFLDVIRICEPTTVVQIYSRFHRKVPVPTFYKPPRQIQPVWYLHMHNAHLTIQ